MTHFLPIYSKVVYHNHIRVNNINKMQSGQNFALASSESQGEIFIEAFLEEEYYRNNAGLLVISGCTSGRYESPDPYR